MLEGRSADAGRVLEGRSVDATKKLEGRLKNAVRALEGHLMNAVRALEERSVDAGRTFLLKNFLSRSFYHIFSYSRRGLCEDAEKTPEVHNANAGRTLMISLFGDHGTFSDFVIFMRPLEGCYKDGG